MFEFKLRVSFFFPFNCSIYSVRFCCLLSLSSLSLLLVVVLLNFDSMATARNVLETNINVIFIIILK